MQDELLTFAERNNRPCSTDHKPWRILVVDDEEDVHRVTKLVLSHITYLDRRIELVSCYTGKELIDTLKNDQNFAMILLDVVMEEDDAGLKAVKYIREVLKNSLIRIVLRTGQPGQAPEQQVIVQYDINDYKAKTELTSEKLFTTIISSLRSYRDLMTIEKSKKGLEKIVKASANIFEMQSMKAFTTGILMQLVSMLKMDDNALYCQASGISATASSGKLKVMAAVGKFEDLNIVDKDLNGNLPKDVTDLIHQALNEKRSINDGNRYALYFQSKVGSENLVYLERSEKIDHWEKDLIDIFCTNISVAFDNLLLNQELDESQKEIIITLGEIVESRSQDMHNHVRRVGEICRFLALKSGLSEEEAEIMRVASAMHDIGKLSIPDSILLKADKLTEEEFEIIKSHPTAGHEMLKFSKRNILKPAGIIAAQHHERYDGKGYPAHLKGDDIHIYARITAVADVFDALISDRCYRKALSLEEILAYFRENSGTQFDPAIVANLFDNIDEIIAIRENVQKQEREEA